MKIATTIGEMYPFTNYSFADAIRAYEGTGFRYLDFSFYTILLRPDSPMMADGWEDIVEECKEVAKNLGFQFVQAHAPAFHFNSQNIESGLAGTIRSIEACGMLGIENMVIHSALFPDIKYPDDELAYFKANEPFFRGLIPAMEKNNVRILFENTTIKHCGGRSYFPIHGRDLNAFIDYMQHPLFGAAWDVGHANCGKCADICPLGAISKTETEIVEICGQKMEIAKIDYDKCRQCKNGAVPNRFTPAGKPDRVAALCNRTCLCYLEENKRIGNTFENTFRKRESWAIDQNGAPAQRNTEVANVLGGHFSPDGNRGNR